MQQKCWSVGNAGPRPHPRTSHLHTLLLYSYPSIHVPQVSTLTALLQPGGPSGVTLAQRVDYLEAEVADLRSQLAPQGGGGQWRPARSYAR